MDIVPGSWMLAAGFLFAGATYLLGFEGIMMYGGYGLALLLGVLRVFNWGVR